MKIILVVSMFILQISLFAQEIPLVLEEQMENTTDQQENEPENDEWIQQLERLRKHPLNINTADEEDLARLNITSLQIQHLLSYRKIFGPFISIYELQAVATWNSKLIRAILPYVTITDGLNVLVKRSRHGEQSVLLRLSQVLQQSKGFDRSVPGTKYAGSPQRIYFRYRYNYKNLLQYGVVGDKDAGETMFGKQNRAGFDFYSFHVFARKLGSIKALALGDFIVNMGQGLIQWQGQSFGKSSAVMNIKRQSDVLCPYSSAGEYNFSRGAGVTIGQHNFDYTIYAAVNPLTANIEGNVITSFNVSGLHRTESETGDRNNIQKLSAGSVLRYHRKSIQVSCNLAATKYSLPVQKRDDPYNLFAIHGDKWMNASIDYSYTIRNLHFFGEYAMDKQLHTALLNGCLLSINSRVDLSLLHRSINRSYQSVSGNAFTENTMPGNETGLYAGINIHTASNWEFNLYTDNYQFPWLKYLVDVPSFGRDYLIQVSHSLGKRGELVTVFRNRVKQHNTIDATNAMTTVALLPKQNWRLHSSFQLNKAIACRARVEICWYNRAGAAAAEGFMCFTDVIIKPPLAKYGLVGRLEYFETDDYNTRIYAYENDVLYSFSVPALFGQGYRFYVSANFSINKRMTVWFRYATTHYTIGTNIGSGTDEIPGHVKDELKLQLRMQW